MTFVILFFITDLNFTLSKLKPVTLGFQRQHVFLEFTILPFTTYAWRTIKIALQELKIIMQLVEDGGKRREWGVG